MKVDEQTLKKSFRRQFLLRLAASPSTLLPAAGGATFLLVAWALGLGGLATLLGLTGMLGGVGGFLTRWLVGKNEKIAKETWAEVRKEAEKILNAELNELARDLEKDGDKRTNELLHELRKLFDAFRLDEQWQTNLGAAVAVDIMAKVEDAFEHSIHLLKESLSLQVMSAELTRETAKQKIAEQRERLITDVGNTVDRLAEHFASIKVISSSRVAKKRDVEVVTSEIDMTLKILRDIDNSVGGYSEEVLRQYEES